MATTEPNLHRGPDVITVTEEVSTSTSQGAVGSGHTDGLPETTEGLHVRREQSDTTSMASETQSLMGRGSWLRDADPDMASNSDAVSAVVEVPRIGEDWK